MKAQNHRKDTARVKVYQGRSHTKKQKDNLELKQRVGVKKARKIKRKTGPGTIYENYQHFEKPKHSYKTHPFNAFKVSPVGGDLEGASSFGGDFEGAFRRPFIGGPRP